MAINVGSLVWNAKVQGVADADDKIQSMADSTAEAGEEAGQADSKLTILGGTTAFASRMVGGLTSKLGILAGGAGAAAAASGALSTVWGTLVAVGGSLVSGIGTVAAAIAGLNPIVLGIVAVAALLAAAWATNFLGIRDKTAAVIGWVEGRITDFVDYVGPYLKDFLSAVVEGRWGDAWNIAKSYVSDTLGIIKGWLGGFTGWLGEKWNGIKSTASNVWGDIKGTIVGAAKGAWNDATDKFDSLKSDAVSAAKGVWSGVKEWMGKAKSKAVGLADDAYTGVKNTLGDLGSAIGNAVKSGFNSIVPSSVNIPSVTIAGRQIGGDTLNLPQLQGGGVVAQTGAAIVHQGEQVIPSGGGGVTINRLVIRFGDQSLDLDNMSRRDVRTLADAISSEIGSEVASR